MTHPVQDFTDKQQTDIDQHDDTQHICLTDIAPNPWNPHRMTAQELQELEQSVIDGGQWRPILVVRMDEPDELDPEPVAPYRIVDGEHLWRALSNLYIQGLVPDTARVMVVANNSEMPTWRQQEIGQTINHGLRGSLEDPEKTREIVQNLRKFRPDEIVAKRMNIGVEGVKHLSRVSTPRTPKAPTMVSAVKTQNEERRGLTVALVFDNAEEVKQFEDLLEDAGTNLGLFKTDFSRRAGRYRIEVLFRLLEEAQGGGYGLVP